MINREFYPLFSKSRSQLVTFILEERFKKVRWEFKYSAEFKEQSDIYNPITGFSNLDRIYRSEVLWPFFQTRIPGLKQPAIKEILQKENIDKNNEFQLLKRFGKKSINNPYELNLS